MRVFAREVLGESTGDISSLCVCIQYIQTYSTTVLTNSAFTTAILAARGGQAGPLMRTSEKLHSAKVFVSIPKKKSLSQCGVERIRTGEFGSFDEHGWWEGLGQIHYFHIQRFQ